MALNCNKEIPGVTDYEGTVGVPAGQCYHCHTGRCPVGITTQDPELRKRLDVDEAANRVYNFLHTLTLEVQMLARACGKTNVHNLEPEDLAALTIEAAAMARVPLAGTELHPGRVRGARAGRDQDAARAPHREPDRLTCPDAAAEEPSGPPPSETREDRRDRRRVPLGQALPLPGGPQLVEGIDLEAATPGKDINWLEDIELLQEEGTPAVFDRYSNSFLKIYFPIPEGRENEIARKVLIAHLQAGNSYGIQLKEAARQVPPARAGAVGRGLADRRRGLAAAVLEGWEPPAH